MAAAPSQPTIYEPSDAQYGLFYWIHFGGGGCHVWAENDPDDTSVRGLTTICARIHQTSQRVDDPTGLKVGIGFGKKFLERILKLKNLTRHKYDTEKQKEAKDAILREFNKVLLQLGYKNSINDKRFPDTGGDVFIHAKGNSVGTLYEFLHLFIDSLRGYRCEIDQERSSVTRGFAYQHHRDISGYMYGIANPVTTDERRNATVMFNTGASFALTQKWYHNMFEVKVVKPDNETVDRQNRYFGIQRENGKLLSPVERPHNAHVSLMKQAQGRRRIVRQSFPFTEENGPTFPFHVGNSPTGLFFLAYANDTAVFGDMLNAMVAGEGDLLFNMSENKSGAYWYFPSMTTLHNLYEATRHNEL